MAGLHPVGAAAVALGRPHNFARVVRGSLERRGAVEGADEAVVAGGVGNRIAKLIVLFMPEEKLSLDFAAFSYVDG